MKTLLLLLFAFSVCSSSHGQKIRQITGVKTYFYPGTDYVPVRIDSNIVIRFDEKGRMIRNSNIEDVCHQYYSYDEKDQLVEEKSYCGEGFSECKSETKGKTKTTRCLTNYHESIRLDSMDEKGRVVYSVDEMTYHDFDTDEISIITSYNSHEYDAAGNEIANSLWGNGYHSCTRREYKNGHLHCVLRSDTINRRKDSLVYDYDESGRIIEMKNYLHVLPGGNYQEFASLNFQYSPLKINRTEEHYQKFNDTILASYYPCEVAYELPEIIRPIEITYSTLKMENPETSLHKKVYAYRYDSEGRLTSVTGKEQSGTVKKPVLEISIGYFPDNQILLSKREYWTSYIYQSHHQYKEFLLQKIVEVDAKDETKITSRHEFTYDYFK